MTYYNYEQRSRILQYLQNLDDSGFNKSISSDNDELSSFLSLQLKKVNVITESAYNPFVIPKDPLVYGISINDELYEDYVAMQDELIYAEYNDKTKLLLKQATLFLNFLKNKRKKVTCIDNVEYCKNCTVHINNGTATNFSHCANCVQLYKFIDMVLHIKEVTIGEYLFNVIKNVSIPTCKSYLPYILYSSKTLVSSNDSNSIIKNVKDYKSKFIIRDDWSNRYLVFQNVLGYEKFVKHIPLEQRCHHEIIWGDKPQKMKIDIDASLEQMERIDITYMNKDWKYNSIDNLNTARLKFKRADRIARYVAESVYEILLERYYDNSSYNSWSPCLERDIIIMQSHRLEVDEAHKKYSYHIIFDNLMLLNSEECKNVIDTFLERMPDKNLRDIIDTSVYKSVQNFRLYGSTKKGELRIKSISASNPNSNDMGSSMNYVEQEKSIARHTYIQVYYNSTFISELQFYKSNTNNVYSNTLLNGNDHSVIDRIHTEYPIMRYDKTVGNIITFVRNSNDSIYCDICNRAHENENFIYLVRVASGYILRCRRADSNKIPGRKYASFKNCSKENLSQHKISTSRAELERCYTQSNYYNPMDKLVKYNRWISVCNSETVPDLYPYINNNINCLFIRSPMKTGKTKAIRKMLEYIPSNLSVCFLSFRQTFTDELFSKLDNFESYKDISGNINPANHPKIIVQMESIRRVVDVYDIIIMDESESIISQLGSKNHASLKFTMLIFTRLIKRCKHCICMDAFLSERSIEVVKSIRPKDFLWDSKSVSILYNTIQNCTDYTYNIGIYGKMMNTLKSITDDININKKIVIVSNGKSELNAIYQHLTELYPEKKIILYTSETSETIKETHLKNVNEVWCTYDIVMYSPTITAGISFEREHFHKMYGIFSNVSCDSLSCMQMMGRIRNLIDKQIIIAFELMPVDVPLSLKDIRLCLLSDRHQLMYSSVESLDFKIDEHLDKHGTKIIYSVDETTPAYIIWLYNSYISNQSKQNIILEILNCVRELGSNITLVEEILNTDYKITNNIKRDQKKEKAASIASAPSITRVDYDALCYKDSTTTVMGPEERDRMHKGRLMVEYDIPDAANKLLDSEKFIAKYSTDNKRAQFKHLKAILKYTNTIYSLYEIKTYELDRCIQEERSKSFMTIDSTFARHKSLYIIANALGFNSYLNEIFLTKDILIENLTANSSIIESALSTFSRAISLSFNFDDNFRRINIHFNNFYGMKIGVVNQRALNSNLHQDELYGFIVSRDYRVYKHPLTPQEWAETNCPVIVPDTDNSDEDILNCIKISKAWQSRYKEISTSSNMLYNSLLEPEVIKTTGSLKETILSELDINDKSYDSMYNYLKWLYSLPEPSEAGDPHAVTNKMPNLSNGTYTYNDIYNFVCEKINKRNPMAAAIDKAKYLSTINIKDEMEVIINDKINHDNYKYTTPSKVIICHPIIKAADYVKNEM